MTHVPREIPRPDGPALSIVIPAYNELNRIFRYLDSIVRYCEAELDGRAEVIVVDDGSVDGLAEVMAGRLGETPLVRVIRHPVNLGKGAALRTGVLAASGEHILLADADGATEIEEESRLRRAILGGTDIAIGSRLLPGPGVRRRRPWRREVIGRAFAWMVRRRLGLPFRDTQCGFKLLTREAAHALFPLCREDGFLIDVELLLLAERHGYRVAEVAISWADVPGSKLRLIRDGSRMLAGLIDLDRRLDRRHRVAADRQSPVADRPATEPPPPDERSALSRWANGRHPPPSLDGPALMIRAVKIADPP